MLWGVRCVFAMIGGGCFSRVRSGVGEGEDPGGPWGFGARSAAVPPLPAPLAFQKSPVLSRGFGRISDSSLVKQQWSSLICSFKRGQVLHPIVLKRIKTRW